METNSEERGMEMSSLLKQAVWSGAVCALAVVLTSLNLLPPVGVQYRVHTQVIVAQPRLEQLTTVLEKDRNAIQAGNLKYVQLCNLKKLDGALGEELLLVELESLWTGRASESHIQAWLNIISRAAPQTIVNTEEAREGRSARWQAELAKHYLNRHRHLSSPAEAVGSTASGESGMAARPRSRVPTQFASLNNSTSAAYAATVSMPLSSEDPRTLERQLAESVTKSELELNKSKRVFQNALEKYAGAIELVGRSRIDSKTTAIPIWLSASVLVLALASGSVFGLLQFRAQSGGAYDPKFVANQLALAGLPVVDEINLTAGTASEQASSPNVFNLTKLIHLVTRNASQYIVRASEWVLALWCFAIACRMLFDPLWRGVVVASPLAAFGRLVSGLP